MTATANEKSFYIIHRKRCGDCISISLELYAMKHQTFKGADNEKSFIFAYSFITIFDFDIV